MAWTSPHSWNVGEIVTAAQLNTTLRDNMNFLYTPPAFRCYNSTDGNPSNDATTAHAFDSNRFDTDTMHSTVTNNTRGIAKTAGKYMFGGTVEFAANVNGHRELQVRG